MAFRMKPSRISFTLLATLTLRLSTPGVRVQPFVRGRVADQSSHSYDEDLPPQGFLHASIIHDAWTGCCTESRPNHPATYVDFPSQASKTLLTTLDPWTRSGYPSRQKSSSMRMTMGFTDFVLAIIAFSLPKGTLYLTYSDIGLIQDGLTDPEVTVSDLYMLLTAASQSEDLGLIIISNSKFVCR